MDQLLNDPKTIDRNERYKFIGEVLGVEKQKHLFTQFKQVRKAVPNWRTLAQCASCHDNVQPIYMLTCGCFGTMYHRKCLDKAWEVGGHRCCPSCHTVNVDIMHVDWLTNDPEEALKLKIQSKWRENAAKRKRKREKAREAALAERVKAKLAPLQDERPMEEQREAALAERAPLRDERSTEEAREAALAERVKAKLPPRDERPMEAVPLAQIPVQDSSPSTQPPTQLLYLPPRLRLSAKSTY